MKLTHIKSQFTSGHIAVIAIAFLILGGLTISQNWETVSGFFEDSNNEVATNTTLYYEYEAPVAPQVLGEDTTPDGPSVLNEDGTLSSLESIGDVLGASSNLTPIDVDAIAVRTSTEASLDKYWDEVYVIESVITPGDFETTLVSQDESQINKQVAEFTSVQTKLRELAVPAAAKKLHQLKIAQYEAAGNLLNNFYQIDSNAEYVSGQLALFIELQQQQEAEIQRLQN